ncbi:MAG: hypothetical protein FWD61_16860 [Phycisphaerales bacterium]|nr:hypothetical protein [Phycisphaerales bacterium]
MNHADYSRPFWKTAARIALIVLVVVATQGCCTYRNVSNDPPKQKFIGHRCILTDDVYLQKGGPHCFMAIEPPSPYPLKLVERGSILRVSYIEMYGGGATPGGFIVFADIENGPKRGKVVIGTLFWARGGWILVVGPPHVPAESVLAIQPLSREDSGIFYTGDSHNGSGIIENLKPLEWKPNP